MKRTSVQRPALVEPVTVVVALVNVLSSTGASQEGLSAGCPGPRVGAAATAGRLSAACVQDGGLRRYMDAGACVREHGE